MSVSQTSLVAFEEVRPGIFGRHWQIYDAMQCGVSYSNTEISQLVGLPINCVTPRVKELRAKNWLIAGPVRACKITGRMVQTWVKR